MGVFGIKMSACYVQGVPKQADKSEVQEKCFFLYCKYDQTNDKCWQFDCLCQVWGTYILKQKAENHSFRVENLPILLSFPPHRGHI